MAMVIKGFLIGMFVSIPVGPLGIITIQRTINSGWKRGFFSGLGAAASDIVYSSAAVFGVSYLHDFISKNEYMIDKIAGILFLAIGIKIFLSVTKNNNTHGERNADIMHPSLSNFLLGLANPMTFLVFLMIFAKLGIVVNPHDIIKNCLLVAAVFTGAALFWLSFSNLISSFRKKLNIELVYQMNRIFGFLIASFGVVSLVKGSLKL